MDCRAYGYKMKEARVPAHRSPGAQKVSYVITDPLWERIADFQLFFIIFFHLLPTALAPILVAATRGIAGAILTESALSFLGIGVQPPTPSWGNILMAGKDNIMIAWWISVFPGLAILLTVLSYNLLGEGIRDIIDPRLRQ